MDDQQATNIGENEPQEPNTANRDENKSPTSGSSSDAVGDEVTNRKEASRKHRRHPKRKRKWKPYTDLSWDERKKQDDRESRRAFAKRERLSAEGHPIAPYNTTQFLMEDHKTISPMNDSAKRLRPTDSSTSLQSMDGESLCITRPVGTNEEQLGSEVRRVKFYADSPHPSDGHGERRELQDDIQRYILNDFSQTYEGIHAEELQSMSKVDLIAECLKLEKKVDMLEKRVKRCKEKHREEPRNQADVRLLEKINHLQTLNSQLMKENSALQSRGQDSTDQVTYNDGAQLSNSASSDSQNEILM